MAKYRIIGLPKKKKGNLEGLVVGSIKVRDKSRFVEIKNWENWDTSFWIKFHTYEIDLILDSGVIEDLYNIIQNMKKEKRLDKDG